MGRVQAPGRKGVATTKEAEAAAAAVAKLAHRVHAMTGGDLVAWLDTPDGEAWAVHTCQGMDLLLRRVASRKAKPAAGPIVLPGDVLDGGAEAAE